MAISFNLCGHSLTTRGRLLKVVKAKEEWDTDIVHPELVVDELKRKRASDLFTFMQRLPVSEPQFNYYYEWDNVAAIPVSTYDHWHTKQLHRNPRNKIKKAYKEGLDVRVVPFDDSFVQGIKGIHDETPIRQGRPYVYYLDPLEKVRAGYITYLERATFIGAFFDNKLIGFLKLVSTGCYARTMGLLTMIQHRDLAPMNALIAKAVEVCAEHRFTHLVYGRYDYGKVGSDTVVDFKYYNGFEHIVLPRYFVPLTKRGEIALALKLHQGLVARLPRPLVQKLRDVKVSYYERRFGAPKAKTKPAPKPTASEPSITSTQPTPADTLSS